MNELDTREKSIVYTEQENRLKEMGIDVAELRSASPLTASHYALAMMPTPKSHIKTRPAKGGGTWKYIPAARVIERLNVLFGMMWSFDIVSKEKVGDEVVVEGRLTVPMPDGRSITKSGFGSKEVQYLNGPKLDETGKAVIKEGKQIIVKTDKPLSIGNDFKAAATDALKKCATQFGIGLDIYLDELEVERMEGVRQRRVAIQKDNGAQTIKDQLKD